MALRREELNLFYVYSREDEALKEQLEKHLKPLRHDGSIKTWHDRKILPGDDWKSQIDKNLNQADIVLLLVSADFIASDYCFDIEMARALERHNEDSSVVIPVILRDVDWESLPFGNLQALPKDAMPVTSWDNKDEAFADVARGIKNAIILLRENKTQKETPITDEEQNQKPDIEDKMISDFYSETEQEGFDFESAKEYGRDQNDFQFSIQQVRFEDSTSKSIVENLEEVSSNSVTHDVSKIENSSIQTDRVIGDAKRKMPKLLMFLVPLIIIVGLTVFTIPKFIERRNPVLDANETANNSGIVGIELDSQTTETNLDTIPTVVDRELGLETQDGAAAVPQVNSAITATVGGAYKISVGAYSVAANAQHRANRLSQQGYPVGFDQQGRLNVVYVGPFASQAEADAVSSQLRKAGQDTSVYADPQDRAANTISNQQFIGITQQTIAPAGEGRSYLQVGAYRDVPSSLSQRSTLESLGLTVYERHEGGYVLLIVGPFASNEVGIYRSQLFDRGIDSFPVN